MSDPWYITAGLGIGIALGVMGLAVAIAMTITRDWDEAPKKLTIPLFTLAATAWYWLPWLFYACSFIPLPPMPPMPPDNRETPGVESAK
jgi:hypothetical protein